MDVHLNLYPWLHCFILFNLSVPLPVWVGLLEEAEESRKEETNRCRYMTGTETLPPVINLRYILS